LRTNIEIDDGLLAEAMAATGLRTTRKVVEAGLRLLARQKRQADARKLFASAWMSRTTPIAVDERLESPHSTGRSAAPRPRSRSDDTSSGVACSLKRTSPARSGTTEQFNGDDRQAAG
jgi:Arc/MetJ family transcription regulator